MKEQVKKYWKDYVLQSWIYASLLVVMAVAAFIFGSILIRGFSAIDMEFLTASPQGRPLGSEGGIFPAIMGSLALGLISTSLAMILGLSAAIYLFLYNQSSKMEAFIRLIVQCIAGIPSIILGLFGYTFFVVLLGFGHSLLAGGLTLSIMIFPVIVINTEKALREMASHQMMASHALGVSKSYGFFKLVWPARKKDILSGVLLGTVYAMGATAPIILTAAVVSASAPNSLFRPVMALPYHLYFMASERISMENAFGTALVLLSMFCIAYGISFYLFQDRKEEER
ncbi:phosphate ABC transporter membrane protein 2, PhoT family [Tindallia magadiensis]|uniref:Phosphate transport system permease protein PstA n=1 Tax=Tindallia magadiensis TaxID=69895 RepID=A0A1I3D8Y6_9FIRM|nr:phosphate ABC transporter permease PstA [Tindallia magadiensis]SFH83153.1 phosphate ABC transporter membrane protein 2, PhoT family [Tindallia magadiensis]